VALTTLKPCLTTVARLSLWGA